MNKTLTGVADRALAAEIRRQRAAFALSLFDGVIRPHELTVGNELLALTYIDRFADAVERRDWRAFLTWIELMFEKHAQSPPMSRVLARGIATIAASFASPARSDFERVAQDVRTIADRPRQAVYTPTGQALDEIDVALDGLVSRLTNFDSATAEHSRAVAMWCMRIGKRMGLTERETSFVMRAGLIHDIGKVTTPTTILNAPYRLSDDEMTIMREHAAAGAAIIGDIPLLAPLTPAVRGHHERVDGRGYPDGLAAADIPLAVRIVSVADSFNAMIGNRPYRLPLAPTVALDQLRRYSGSQFDPNVVEAMIDVVHPRR